MVPQYVSSPQVSPATCSKDWEAGIPVQSTDIVDTPLERQQTREPNIQPSMNGVMNRKNVIGFCGCVR
jgi:hypothetical protein